MVTVSQEQRVILRNALANGEVIRVEVLAECYGWPLHGDGFSHHRFKVKEEIGTDTYNAGNASVTRNLRLLRDIGLLDGFKLTAEGHDLLRKLTE